MRERRGLPVRDMTLADLPTALALMRQALEDRETPYPGLDLAQFERDLVFGLALPEVKALVAVTKKESFRVKGVLIGRIHARDMGLPRHIARIEVLAVDPIFRDRTPSVTGRMVDQFWTWAQAGLHARGEPQAILEIAHSPGGYQADAVAALGAVAYEIRSVVASEATAMLRDNDGGSGAHPRAHVG